MALIDKELLGECKPLMCEGIERVPLAHFQESFDSDGRQHIIEGLCPNCHEWHQLLSKIQYRKKQSD